MFKSSKIYRFTALTVGFIMLFQLCLASCGGKDDEAPEPVEVNLSEYVIVRSQDASKAAVSAAVSLRTRLKQAGISVEMTDDWSEGTESDVNKKEILFGATNRSESSEVAQSINGYGYAIALRGNKIVITAAKDSFLQYAADYFVNNVANGNSIITLDSNYLYLSEPYEVVSLVSDGKCNYTVIREEGSSDHIVGLVSDIREKIVSLSDAKIVRMNIDADVEASDDALEILIGHTNRPESAKALEALGADEYIVTFINGKIVINARSLLGIEQASLEFTEMLADNVDSDKSITIPIVNTFVGSLGCCPEELPEPSGLSLVSAYAGLGDTYESVWGGASADDFDVYREALGKGGYSLYDENRIGDNLFAVYTKKSVAVYVSFTPWDGTLRVISETFSALPVVSEQPFETVTDTVIAQMKLNGPAGNFGMSYVITLADGSYIVIDGGGREGDDDAALYTYLRDNNKRTDKKIVIAAWIFTHEHYDHVANFIKFSKQYGQYITLESVILNFVREYECEGAGVYYSQIQDAISKYGNVKMIKAHTGQRMKIRNAELEVLYTNESLAPIVFDGLNNTSTVFRVKAEGKSAVFFGDIEETKSIRQTAIEVIYNMYGETLKSDILQVAHHGLSGASVDIYAAVAPEIALWPVEHHSNDYENAMRYESSVFLFEMKNRGIIKDIFISAESEGNIEILMSTLTRL
ncbi:MAG: MBL fold metallo-hydrolase [Eubacteriales bacterium]